MLLLLSGIPLELVHDGANVSLIFTVGTVVGAFLSYATDTTLLVGASAGVYALLFTHIGNTVVNGDLMSPKSLLITLILNLPLVALFLYDVISIGVGKESSTSFTAHLGGLVTGLTFGTCIIRNFNVQTWENNVKYVCWLVFILFGGALFFCQFATFDSDFVQVVEGSAISMPKLSAGSASFSTGPGSCSYTQNQHTSSKVVAIGGYSGSSSIYSNNIDCRWTLQVPEG